MSEKIKKYESFLKGATNSKNLEIKVPLFTGHDADIDPNKNGADLLKDINLSDDKSFQALNKRQDDLNNDFEEYKKRNSLDADLHKNIKNTLSKTHSGTVKLNKKIIYMGDLNSSAQKIWGNIMDSDRTSEERNNTKRVLNEAYSNPIHRKNLSRKELAYINKLPEQIAAREKQRKADLEESVKFFSDLEAMYEFRRKTEEADLDLEKLLEKKREPAQGLAYLLGMD